MWVNEKCIFSSTGTTQDSKLMILGYAIDRGWLFVGGPSIGPNLLQHRFYESMNIELFYPRVARNGNNDSFYPFKVSAKNIYSQSNIKQSLSEINLTSCKSKNSFGSNKTFKSFPQNYS